MYAIADTIIAKYNYLMPSDFSHYSLILPHGKQKYCEKGHNRHEQNRKMAIYAKSSCRN